MGGAEQLVPMCCLPLKLRWMLGGVQGENGNQGARHEAADTGAALGCSLHMCYCSLQVEPRVWSAAGVTLVLWRGSEQDGAGNLTAYDKSSRNCCTPLRLLSAWWGAAVADSVHVCGMTELERYSTKPNLTLPELRPNSASSFHAAVLLAGGVGILTHPTVHPSYSAPEASRCDTPYKVEHNTVGTACKPIQRADHAKHKMCGLT